MRTRLHVFVALPLLAVAPGCRARCCPPPAPVVVAHPAPPPSPSARSISGTPREGRQVLIELALYAVPEERFVGSLAGRFGDGVAPLVMHATEARGWQMALTTEGGAEILQLPSVVTQAGEEATVEVGETVRGGGWQGVTARALPRMDGERVRLDLVVTQRPVAHDAFYTQSVSTRGARLGSGESLLLMSAAPKAGRRLVVVTTATVLPGS